MIACEVNNTTNNFVITARHNAAAVVVALYHDKCSYTATAPLCRVWSGPRCIGVLCNNIYFHGPKRNKIHLDGIKHTKVYVSKINVR